MSPKAKKPAPKAKAEKVAKVEKTSSKKSTKAAIAAEPKALEAAPAEGSEEEGEDDAPTSSSGGGGNAAALAAATGATEMSASFKNFRHHPDMENFYRFIYENDLRLEALAIINDMMVERANRKQVRSAKANAH